jgi:hypothetical protein
MFEHENLSMYNGACVQIYEFEYVSMSMLVWVVGIDKTSETNTC